MTGPNILGFLTDLRVNTKKRLNQGTKMKPLNQTLTKKQKQQLKTKGVK